MVLNSLLPLIKLPGWMATTLSLVKSLRVWMFWNSWNNTVLKVVDPLLRLKSLNLANSRNKVFLLLNNKTCFIVSGRHGSKTLINTFGIRGGWLSTKAALQFLRWVLRVIIAVFVILFDSNNVYTKSDHYCHLRHDCNSTCASWFDLFHRIASIFSVSFCHVDDYIVACKSSLTTVGSIPPK